MAEILSFKFHGKEIKYHNYDFPPFPSKYYMESDLEIIEKYMDLSPGDVFLDVGCAVGSWSLPALSLGANVVGFEPIHIYSPILYDNITLNDFKNFRLILRVLWNEDNKFFPFYFGRYEQTILMEPFLVNSIRLDSLLFEKIDLIKIDVEGSELKVLQGGALALAKHRPKIILEHHENIVGTIEEILKLLPSGYTKLQLEDGKWLFECK